MSVQFSSMLKTAEDLDYVWTLMKAYAEWCLDDDFHDEQTVKALISQPGFSYFYAHNERGEKIGFVCFQQATAWAATFHALFMDGRLRGREQAVNELCRRLLNLGRVKIIRGYIPVERRATRAWAKRGGWSEDGIMRMAVKRHGEYKDFAIVSYRGE
jgi:hypothetical protein